ncbi:C2 calcium-dependent domain-containing protein 4C-like [Sinocyclocheilus rhinocerous]|uniref:C2 calcium-dependent domain-containing protein 4C-like n=1 Tax=Sinocyclocheilus rhinocerous TaxID=307959 RepID=UPI0007B9B2D0|nr:PREDICTED: C2 calcium-dependent domain-containing protein 4C-like [Sinocyclocheilus rhinocerous]
MFACGVASLENIMTPKGYSRQNLPLTPGRIPKFTIPPKLSMSPRLCRQKEKDEDTYKLLSPESPEEQSPGHRPPTGSPSISAKLRFTPKMKLKRLQKSATEDLSDPSTCAAMSLEHVGKVTTPYGFRTLAASPSVSRRESLFHKQGRCEERTVPVDSLASPTSSNSTSNSTSNRNGSARKLQDGLKDCCSPRRSKREGLELLLNKPLTVLRSLTPKRKKPNLKLKF